MEGKEKLAVGVFMKSESGDIIIHLTAHSQDDELEDFLKRLPESEAVTIKRGQSFVSVKNE